MIRAFIGIGSNLGDRQGYIDLARKQLAGLPDTQVTGFSSVYETEPVGPVEQGSFLNAVAELSTGLAPTDLLAGLQEIEQLAGRSAEQRQVKWGPRTLDLDILLYADQVIELGALQIPHPQMHRRAFVLRPLADLDATLMHPQLNLTVEQMLTQLEEQAARHDNQKGD